MIGLPCSSVIHPGSTVCPRRLARASLLPATTLGDASYTKGGLRRAGAANAMALSPSSGLVPNVGTMPTPPVVVTWPSMRCSSAMLP